MTVIAGIDTVADIVRYYGQKTPNKTALVFEGRRISYQELDSWSNQLANTLLQKGLKPGDHVAHLGKNTAEYFALLFATAKLGSVLVGINWRLAAPEVQYILKDSDARFLFIDEELAYLTNGANTDLPLLNDIVLLGGDSEEQNNLTQWSKDAPQSDPKCPVRQDDVLYQMYTSGTTGRPKGAEITHFGVLHARRLDDKVDDPDWHVWNGDEVQLVQAPVFHLTGNVWAIIGLYVGATLVVHRDFDMDRIFHDMEAEKITHAIFVPAMLMALLQHPASTKTDFSRLDTIFYGASPIPLDLLRRAVACFRTKFVQLYGMTEISGSATFLPASDHDPKGENPRMRSAGRPFPWTRIKILDEKGQALSPNQVGEVVIKADTVMKGYWRRPEATAEVLRDGWFYTGDAGYLDADGYLFIHDRVKDMIISGGENIYPAEVESCLYAHPDIKEAAIIGVPSEKWGEAVKAIIVREPGKDLSEEDVIAHARASIAGYKCPRSVDFVEALPRNATGKVLRRHLRDPYWEGHKRKLV